MKPDRPIGFDAKLEMLNGLGEFSLSCPERFTWTTRHAGVSVQAEDGVCIQPKAYATNPYSVVEVHWRMLTEGCPILSLTGRGDLRHAFWAEHRFIEIEV